MTKSLTVLATPAVIAVAWLCLPVAPQGAAAPLGQAAAAKATPGITSKPYGKHSSGTPLTLYTLTNSKASKPPSPTTAASSSRFKVPDRTGRWATSSWASIRSTLPRTHPYFGALVGRYGNRIGKAKFTLDGKEYTLADEQRREPPARRHRGLRQEGLDGEAGEAERTARRSN